jgi:selenocysteine lyase/cysteine desulfurase
MFPFSLHELGCDAYATSGHKWMLGPKETGLLYVRKEMLDIIQPKFTGAYSAGEFDLAKGTLDFVPTAQRYEYGTVSIPLRFGLGAAVNFLQKIGVENIWKRDQSLSTRLYKGLKSIPYVSVLSPESSTERSALVTFKHEKIPYGDLQRHLDTYKLRTRGVGEGGVNALRISTHLYNSPEEVDRALEAVKTAYRG